MFIKTMSDVHEVYAISNRQCHIWNSGITFPLILLFWSVFSVILVHRLEHILSIDYKALKVIYYNIHCRVSTVHCSLHVHSALLKCSDILTDICIVPIFLR